MSKSYQYKGFTVVQGYSSWFIFSSSRMSEDDFVGQRDTSMEAEYYIDEILLEKFS